MTIYELFLFFYIYSILGWIAEVIYCRIIGGKFTNRGFLNGPYCPIYGFGALIIVLLLNPFKDNLFLVFILGMILTSTLEYITSFLMEKAFNAKWWDYSDMKFNLNGRVCLLNSCEFAVLGVLLTYIIHPRISSLIQKIPVHVLTVISVILFILLLIDFTITLSTILNLKEKLKHLKAITEQIKSIPPKETELYKNMEKLKNDIFLKTSIMHKRIIEAFPDLKMLKMNKELTEIKENIHEKFVNKLQQKIEKRKKKQETKCTEKQA